MTGLRIALLTYSTKPRGGVVHTLALAEALVRAGAQVDVWTLGRGGDGAFYRQVDPAVDLMVVPFPTIDDETVGQRIVRSIDTLGAAFAPGDYDIVHAQDCISANAVPRCIRTIHHLDSFSTPELVACHERAIVRPAGHICVSKAVAEEVRAGWGIRATVIANGVEYRRFADAAGPASAAARQHWRERLGEYVLAVGGIEPRKGTIDLLEGFALLRDRRPELSLVIAGGETLFDYREYRSAFDARALEFGVAPVELGVVDNDALPTLVAAAGALAFVSTKEGFGLAAMEALAAGVPVVARDLPVLREVFGESVVYARDQGEIARALADCLKPAELNPRRELGKALARRHSWDVAAEAHLRFYADFLRNDFFAAS